MLVNFVFQELNQKLSTDQDQAMADMTTFQQGGAIPTHR